MKQVLTLIKSLCLLKMYNNKTNAAAAHPTPTKNTNVYTWQGRLSTEIITLFNASSHTITFNATPRHCCSYLNIYGQKQYGYFIILQLYLYLKLVMFYWTEIEGKGRSGDICSRLLGKEPKWGADHPFLDGSVAGSSHFCERCLITCHLQKYHRCAQIHSKGL